MTELRQERTSDYRNSDDEFAVRSYFKYLISETWCRWKHSGHYQISVLENDSTKQERGICQCEFRRGSMSAGD